MNTCALSICILSYNQAPEIERLLASLDGQITSNVEVVIRDDSVDNETEEVVRKFSKRFPIRYFHGKKEGIDNTIFFLTEEARGKFVWWLGDEEVVPGGVQKVLDVIHKYPDATFVWANFHVSGTKKLVIDVVESRFFADREEVLDEAGAGLGFISATIINRSIALTGIERSKKYIGSAFVNLFLVLHVLAQQGRYFCMRGPVIVNYPATSEEIKEVTARRGEIKNQALEVFGFNFANILREFDGPFSHTSIRAAIAKTFGQTWRGMLVGWVGGWDTPEGKRIRMLRFFWSFPEAWIAFALFLVPLPVNRILYRIYKIFFSHRKWVFGRGGSED